jgi:hypothetical protein
MFLSKHHGSISYVGAAQPSGPVVRTPNWLNHHSTAVCPDGQQADLASGPKFCPDRQPGSIRIIRGPQKDGSLLVLIDPGAKNIN